ncbi:MAG TPA: tripartite tricarboxylate transporter substrate binding protein [Burkholderiales bacterium]|jgi:tripartite-type tricarboxylate transporter receptor subunit TctC
MNRVWLFIALFFPVVVFSQNYPSKPVRIIIPFAPGGASDFVGRIMQPKLQELLGQPIVVENKPGAAGSIGMDYVAKSAPDGYTVFLGNIGSIAINPAVMPAQSSVPTRDLVAVTQVVDVPSIIIAHPSLPVSNVKELIAYAKANPGKLNYGSPGSGSVDRLVVEILRKVGGLDMVHVPYKGGAGPAVAGLMGGETNLMSATAASSLPGIKAGRLKALAVTGEKRLEQLPNTPTVKEEGYPDLTASSWQGLFVPTGTPREAIDKLYDAAVKTMAVPEVVSRLATGGAFAVTSPNHAAFGEYVAAETKRWARIAKESNATAD